MNPYDIQNNFFKEVTTSTHIDNDYISIYSELVNFRIVEVIQSTYPIFVSYIGKDKLNELVTAFIIYGSKTPYVWQISNEFILFLINQYGISKIQKEILLFEQKQILIYVLNKDVKSKKMNTNRRYKLSKNASIQIHNFNIIERNFDKVDKQYILIYKNIEDYDVYHITISKFLYVFLKNLRNNNTLEKAQQIASKQCGIKFDDAKEISFNVINNFINTGIIV